MIWASVGDIVKSEEVDELIKEGIFNSIDDVDEIQNMGMIF